MELTLCVSPTAWGWGDPHITTLDGAVYTFNGFGEYTLLSIHGNAFVLQGRTHTISSDAMATQFVAFAFGTPDDIVEVSLSPVLQCSVDHAMIVSPSGFSIDFTSAHSFFFTD